MVTFWLSVVEVGSYEEKIVNPDITNFPSRVSRAPVDSLTIPLLNTRLSLVMIVYSEVPLNIGNKTDWIDVHFLDVVEVHLEVVGGDRNVSFLLLVGSSLRPLRKVLNADHVPGLPDGGGLFFLHRPRLLLHLDFLPLFRPWTMSTLFNVGIHFVFLISIHHASMGSCISLLG